MYKEKNSQISLLSEGTKLKDGKYIIQTLIRSSNISNVYLVKEPFDLKRTLIVKQLYPKKMQNGSYTLISKTDPIYNELIKAFEYEKKILILLKDISPTMDNYYVDSFEDNGFPYIVFRQLNGQTLTSYVKEKYKFNGFSDSEKYKLFLNILKFICRLHKKGILHGDISPDNIIITHDGQAVLIDYGNTIISQNLLLFQKKGYSAPELYNPNYGMPGKYSDIYSIGATFCYILSGKSIKEISTAGSIDISHINTNKYFHYIVSKCLKVNIAERFHSVSEIFFILHLYRFRYLYNILLCIPVLIILLGYIEIYQISNRNSISSKTTLENDYNITDLQEYQEKKDGIFIYQIKDGEAIILGSDSKATEIEIPVMIDTYPVTTIKGLNKNAVSVVIPEGVKRIEGYSFQNCQYLKHIEIPSSVNFIDNDAFINCGSLKEIEISPDNNYYYFENNKIVSRQEEEMIFEIH